MAFNIKNILKNSAISFLFSDNKALLSLLKRVFNISKIKHIDTNFHQIVDKIKNRAIKVFFILNKDILIDSFIKSLFFPVFKNK